MPDIEESLLKYDWLNSATERRGEKGTVSLVGKGREKLHNLREKTPILASS